MSAAAARLEPVIPATPVPATLVELVGRAGTLEPDRPALIFEDGVSITRGELLERCETFAGYLREQLQPGQMVAAMTRNRIEFMVGWLATVAAGSVFVAINPEAGEHDLIHVLNDSRAVLVITETESAARIESLRDQLPDLRSILVLGDDEPNGLQRWAGTAPLRFSEVQAEPDAITNVYYTSGTTGPPKGCMVSNAYWQRLVGSYLSERGLSEDERILCCLKFFYNDPSWQLLASLHVGAALVAMRRFSVSRFWNIVRDFGITQLFTIGSIPALLLTVAPSEADRRHNLRFGVQVAIDAGRHQEMTDRWGIPWIDSYGLTETGGLISVPLAEARRMTGTGVMGRPREGVEIQLIADGGGDVGPGQPGELLVRVRAMMQGYLNRPEATAEVLDADGWFHTGDYVRQDGNGWLYFVGRKKDVIRRAGENIAAGEVEEVLRGHPDVIDAAAVPVPDPLRGEEILVHVYTSVDETDALAQSIWQHAAAQMAPHKVPRFLVFRSTDFPRTPSMRVIKKQIDRSAGAPGARDREAP